MEAALGIALLAGLALILVIIRRLISAGVHKGVNAAANAVKRSQEQKNPPKQENLAERYGQGNKER